MKLILFLFLLFNILSANVITRVEILKDQPSFTFENIKKDKNFKRTKENVQRFSKDEYWMKVSVDKNLLTSHEYILKVHSIFDTNKIVFDDILKRTYFDKNTIELGKESEIYLKVKNTLGYVDINFKVYTKEEYYNKVLFEKSIHAVAYGIVFSAFLYYLAFFIFNRQKSFIYYSLTQLSMLFMLLNPNIEESMGVLLFFIFSNLFTKEFLNTKKYTPKLDKVLTYMIYFYVLDTIFGNYFSIMFPSSIFLMFYILTAIIIYNETKFQPILFYIIGWSIVIISFIFVDFQFFFINLVSSSFDNEILFYVVAPIESLVLAFALSYKVKLLEEQNIEKERLLIHQNKLAAMGEMISNIAHQWRQPLTHLSYIFMNINSSYKHQKLDEKYLTKKTKEATVQLEYMSNTIDDFKDFYTPKKDMTHFMVKNEIQKAINIIRSVLETTNITIDVLGEDFEVNGYDSEFSQVVLNLITNAKDALLEKQIKNPKIKVLLQKNKIEVIDNAGGVDKVNVEKIFDPYFTTKEKGTGIGLYMSKTIIEKHFNGTLTYKNQDDGSVFSIRFL